MSETKRPNDKNIGRKDGGTEPVIGVGGDSEKVWESGKEDRSRESK